MQFWPSTQRRPSFSVLCPRFIPEWPRSWREKRQDSSILMAFRRAVSLLFLVEFS